MQTVETTEVTSPVVHAGVRKAAILVLVLGTDLAREVFQRLPESEIRRLAAAAGGLSGVTRDEIEAVLRDFVAQWGGGVVPESAGGVFEFLMERALGSDRIQSLLSDEVPQNDDDPFHTCASASTEVLAGVLSGEHPQSIAIVLSSLPASAAGKVLEALGPEQSSDVIYRLANLKNVPEDVRHDVATALASELRAMGSTGGAPELDGTSLAVEITKALDAEFSDEMLDLLEDADEDFAADIRSKLFVFEDLAMLDARTMQRLLREVDSKQLMVALKGTSPEVQDAIFGAMSSRAAEMLREDMEASPPVRIKDVEDAQGQIIEVAFRLENEGAIALPRGGGGDMV